MDLVIHKPTWISMEAPEAPAVHLHGPKGWPFSILSQSFDICNKWLEAGRAFRTMAIPGWPHWEHPGNAGSRGDGRAGEGNPTGHPKNARPRFRQGYLPSRRPLKWRRFFHDSGLMGLATHFPLDLEDVSPQCKIRVVTLGISSRVTISYNTSWSNRGRS